MDSASSTSVSQRTSSKESRGLCKILYSFASSSDDLRREYGVDLKKSLTALEYSGDQRAIEYVPPTSSEYVQNFHDPATTINGYLDLLKEAFSSRDRRFKWLQLGDLWPCITVVTVLELLRSSASHQFGKDMKRALVSFGMAIAELQRLRRINHALTKNDALKADKELRSPGHENWDPMDFLDWLLLELESNILIRKEQIEVAHAMISPPIKSNSVLQMNMGKGMFA
jgi:hypothetical protein